MSHRGQAPGLFTDLYELTMAQAYWQSGVTDEATFSLFFRSYPPERAYFVFAGLTDVLDYLEGFRFTAEDIDHLGSMGLFDSGFLAFLSEVRFTGAVNAMREGTIFFANEPVIEVTAPVIEAQIVETYLVNQISLQTVMATKAARVVHAAPGKSLVDFGARRGHGVEAANSLARTTYMVGFAGTSDVLAGALYAIPTFGTMAHSFITAFQEEIEAFRAYALSFPDTSIFLVDTYDTLDGTRKSIEVGKEMRRRGHNLRGIRLDSGDLLELALQARSMLDKAGLQDVQVFASGGLDEFEVDRLVRAGAPIDGFGIGTKIGVSADAPHTDCAYKLVQYGGRPVVKLSTAKETLPGPKQVHRLRGSGGMFKRDVISSSTEGPLAAGSEQLLSEVMRDGRRVDAGPTLRQSREYFAREFALLPAQHKELRAPASYQATVSKTLDDINASVRREIRRRDSNVGPPDAG